LHFQKMGDFEMGLRNGTYSFSVNMICLLLLVGNMVYLIAAWDSLPEQIPMHFDGAGNINQYGGRGWVLFMPIMNWIFFLGFTAIEYFPQIWNTGVKITEENKERVHRIIKNMLVTVKLAMTVTFVFISVYQLLSKNLPGWFMPASLFAFFAPMAFYIVKLIKAR